MSPYCSCRDGVERTAHAKKVESAEREWHLEMQGGCELILTLGVFDVEARPPDPTSLEVLFHS